MSFDPQFDALQNKREILEPQSFIRRYKAAVKAKLTRDQFAKLLGILPDSVIRRRLAVKKEFSVELALLPNGTDEIDQDRLEKYNSYLSDLEKKDHVKVHTNVSGFKRYVITSAQNATPVHVPFFSAIQTYCEHNDARLIVIPYRYKNPTSIWNDNNKDQEYWASELHEFLTEEELRLSNNLRVMGNIKIQPTATQPLSGFDGYTGTDSAVFAHPKIQLKTVPTPSQLLPKILTTTGTITVPNYTDSKAGWKSDFHHSLAALIVEIDDDGLAHIRHIHADDETGAFYDITKYYTATEVTDGHRISALVTGDTHAEFIDAKVKAATYTSPDSLMKVLNPEIRILHDVEDFYSRNHHHRGNDIIAVGKHFFGRNNVEKSLQITADFIDETTVPDTINIIVKSNHDEAFDRWLREADPKFDPENAKFYYYMKYHQLANIKPSETGFSTIDAFEFWCHNPDQEPGLASKDHTRFLKRDESFVVSGIELGFHGDMGPNGSRGSIRNFANIGPKTVIGHSHTPGIHEGCYQVGVSARLDMSYVSGPSSWMHTHCIIYPDGSRTLVNILNGKWRITDK